MVSEVRSLVWYEAVCTLLLLVLAVVAFLLGEAGQKWAWLGCGYLRLLVRLFICFAEEGFYGIVWAFCFWKALLP